MQLGAFMLAGAAVAAAAPAEAHVAASLNLGLFGPTVAVPVVAPLPGYCYGPTYYANCAYPVYGEPVFWNGIWFDNASYRIVGGHREFWVYRGWHEARAGARGGFHR